MAPVYIQGLVYGRPEYVRKYNTGTMDKFATRHQQQQRENNNNTQTEKTETTHTEGQRTPLKEREQPPAGKEEERASC
jgi:hypothetical protein